MTHDTTAITYLLYRCNCHANKIFSSLLVTRKNTYSLLVKEFTKLFNTDVIISLLNFTNHTIINKIRRALLFSSTVPTENENNHEPLKQSPSRGHVSDISVRNFVGGSDWSTCPLKFYGTSAFT